MNQQSEFLSTVNPYLSLGSVKRPTDLYFLDSEPTASPLVQPSYYWYAYAPRKLVDGLLLLANGIVWDCFYHEMSGQIPEFLVAPSMILLVPLSQPMAH